MRDEQKAVNSVVVVMTDITGRGAVTGETRAQRKNGDDWTIGVRLWRTK